MIRRAFKEDACLVAQLAAQLRPSQTIEEFTGDFEQLLSQDDAAVFLCLAEGEPVGFAQCQERSDYVEGTESSPVGYLEGIFVAEAYRRRGYAARLLAACEGWAKDRGCTEFASDCELHNTQSLDFHLRCGFREANRIICFTKKL